MNNLEHDFSASAAPDVSKRASFEIWFYFIILGIILIILIISLIIYFQFQLDYQHKLKIGEVETREVLDYKASNGAVLSGKIGLFPDKKNTSINTAMRRLINDIRSNY